MYEPGSRLPMSRAIAARTLDSTSPLSGVIMATKWPCLVIRAGPFFSILEHESRLVPADRPCNIRITVVYGCDLSPLWPSRGTRSSTSAWTG